MKTWKLPPKEKIYEAFSVLAENRFEMDAGKALVRSSDGKKKYKVTWSLSDNGSLIINSNDNASQWQGYTGYPIIAILMINGYLAYDKTILQYFKEIPWNALNKTARNNYSKVVNEVLDKLNDEELVNRIRRAVDGIFEQLARLKPLKGYVLKKQLIS